MTIKWLLTSHLRHDMKSIGTELIRSKASKIIPEFSDHVLSGLNAIGVLFSIMVQCAVLKSPHTLGISTIMALSDA